MYVTVSFILLFSYLCLVLVIVVSLSFGEYVCRPSLLYNPCLSFDKNDNNNFSTIVINDWNNLTSDIVENSPLNNFKFAIARWSFLWLQIYNDLISVLLFDFYIILYVYEWVHRLLSLKPNLIIIITIIIIIIIIILNNYNNNNVRH